MGWMIGKSGFDCRESKIFFISQPLSGSEKHAASCSVVEWVNGLRGGRVELTFSSF